MKEPYEPRGKVVPLIEAARANPDREWTIAEAAAFMGMQNPKLGGMLLYPMRAGLIFRGKRADGVTVFRGRPFDGSAMPPPPVREKSKPQADAWPTDPEDARIPRVVPGWTPPRMVCQRAGA